MLRVCGIEIKSKTAYLVVLEGSKKEFNIIKTSPLKIELLGNSQNDIKNFLKDINEFLILNNVDKIFIKEGTTKGKFKSGAPVFKIETMFQLNELKVTLIKALTLSAFYKKDEVNLPKNDLRQYQQVAYQVAYYGLED